MSDATIQVQGGLGNQLFQLQFGILLRKIRKTKVVFQYCEDANKHANSSFTDFDLASLQLDKTEINLVSPIAKRRSLDRIREKWFQSILEFSENHPVYNDAQLSVDNCVEKLENLIIPKGARIRGFFQNINIFEVSKRLKVNIAPQLKYETKWYKEMYKRIHDEAFTVMHVRRGDYEHSPFWGLLSAKYYEMALESLGKKNPGEILIFTDSPISTVREFSNSKILKKIEVIQSPAESPAAESLILMSKAESLVLSNSTFSIWGALLSQAQGIIVPSKFYCQGVDDYKRFPTEWEKVKSEWVVI